MNWEYSEQYAKLLAELQEHKAEWNLVVNSPIPVTGVEVYFLLKDNLSCQPIYDVGFWDGYRGRWWWDHHCLEGQWNTEFGNLDNEVVGWKLKYPEDKALVVKC